MKVKRPCGAPPTTPAIRAKLLSAGCAALPAIPILPDAGSAKDPDGGSDETGQRSAVPDLGDLMEVALLCKWHVVTADTATGDIGSSSAPGPAAEPLSVPPDAKAILVPSEVRNTASSAQLVKKLRETGDVQVPVIVVLVGAEAFVEEPTAILRMQRDFHGNDVDDVIAKTGDRGDLRLAIAMSIFRVQLKFEWQREVEHRLQTIYERRLKLEVELREERCRDSSDGMFWSCVQRVFQGFPPLEHHITRTLGVGEQVGPCKLMDFLGHGTFGEVYRAENLQTGEREAVKVVAKERLCTLREVSHVWRELKLLNKLDHENIVALYGALQGPCHVFVRMELAGPCNLFRALKLAGGRLSLQVAAELQAQLASAVDHCHSRGVAHRDIKPENIAVSDSDLHLKLLDFGCAVNLDKECHDIVGTMPFIPPEVIAASLASPYFPAGCDVWASGLVLFETLCGKGRIDRMLQWAGNTGNEEKWRWEVREFFLSNPGAVVDVVEQELSDPDDDLVILLRGMLEVNPRRRWTANQVVTSNWLRTALEAATDERQEDAEACDTAEAAAEGLEGDTGGAS